MSNGYLVAARADLAAAHDIADGFGLDVIDASTVSDPEGLGTALSAAANVGLIVSSAAADDAHFVSLLQVVARGVLNAQLILADAGVRERLGFLPASWPAMSLDDARARAQELVRRRDPPPQDDTPTHAHPLPPTPVEPEQPQEPPPVVNEEPPPEVHAEPETDDDTAPETSSQGGGDVADAGGETDQDAALDDEHDEGAETFGAEQAEEHAGDSAVSTELPASIEPPEPPPRVEPAAPAPQTSEPPPAPLAKSDHDSAGAVVGSIQRKREASVSAPADATAFAPKKLRRNTPELVRIVVHQPKDLNAVIKAARKIDPRAEPAPSGMSIGDVPLGASIGISLEVRGATSDGALQRRVWNGDPVDFAFSVEADSGVKQVVFLARVFVDDAQIGVLAFTRNVTGPSKKPASDGDRVRLKRHKRVFISYSSKDRETVSQIATAYEAAGIEHFWDRASLKSGEEWSPRLRREIERADLFHLCWSKSAATSEWVEKEAEFALTRRRKNSGKPDITVQMLDGPPWAAHPVGLDSINFDDFVRAAIVGYARGDSDGANTPS